LLWLLAAMPVMSADEPSQIPKHFSASIGGFLGASYELELRDGILTYTTFRGGRSNLTHATVKPNAAQWREFQQVLDGLKVWQWRAEYPNKGVKDGTHWSLDIAYADHSIKSHGVNSYPDSTGRPNGKPEPTKAFKGYVDAVEKLIGGKVFR
jgi:hypothetical protein